MEVLKAQLQIPLLTYLQTYLLTPCRGVFPEKQTSSQLIKNIPEFYGTRRFITSFTSAHHLSLSRGISTRPMRPVSLPEDSF